MGVGGILEYLSDIFSGGHNHHKRKNNKKQQQYQTVELKVRMDCDGCGLKVRKALSSMKGVKSVEINRKKQKVTVSGCVESSRLLKKVKSTGKKAEMWPYTPYNLVTQPYIAQVYNENASHGYVRNLSLSATLCLSPPIEEGSIGKKTKSPTYSVMTTQILVLSCDQKESEKKKKKKEEDGNLLKILREERRANRSGVFFSYSFSVDI